MYTDRPVDEARTALQAISARVDRVSRLVEGLNQLPAWEVVPSIATANLLSRMAHELDVAMMEAQAEIQHLRELEFPEQLRSSLEELVSKLEEAAAGYERPYRQFKELAQTVSGWVGMSRGQLAS